MPRRILVTSALPYVNGHIHIGHLVEHIQTNIWVRFQRLRGHRVAYFCGADTHGTATMIAARKAGRPESAIIAEQVAHHVADLQGFDVVFDHYGSTDSPANRALVNEIWAALRRDGLVATREVTQLFDPQAGTFLADRFVKGTCPNCKAPDQYGDSCDKCGTTYAPTDLIDARSTLSGAAPEIRSSLHYFVTLEKLRGFIEEWTQRSGALEGSIARLIKGNFLGADTPLRDWDVSRPAPYFGFEIPDAPGHYFYVWLDAPIGYIAATKEWCDANGERLDAWWRDPSCEIHHFIGKDIYYFHTVFWPAMLKTAGFALPTKVHIHGMLTIDGEKLSKSKGTFIGAKTYLKHLDPSYLRYFVASKLTAEPHDIDLNLEEFRSKVNSDLVGKVVNLASRTAKFMKGRRIGPGALAIWHANAGFEGHAVNSGERIAELYEQCNYAAVTREIMQLADLDNKIIDEKAPWVIAKDPSRVDELTLVCSAALIRFWRLVVYLAPIVPKLAECAEKLFGRKITSWKDAEDLDLTGTEIGDFTHMLARVDPNKVTAMIEESKDTTAAPAVPAAAAGAPAAAAVDDDAALKAEPLAATISFEEFGKVDLRVGRVLAAEEVKGAKKILKLTLGLGGAEQRTVFAGIRTAYGEPAKLVGRLVVFVANLAPRQMSFGTSEGMVVAAGPGGQEIFLLAPDSGAKPGMRVR